MKKLFLILFLIGAGLCQSSFGQSNVNVARIASPAIIHTGQVVIGTSEAEITGLSPNKLRRSVLIQNLDTTISIFVGQAGISTTSGSRLLPGESVVIDSINSIHAIAASGTPTLAYLEETD